MKNIIIYSVMPIAISVIAIFIYKFYSNPIEQICPGTVYFQVLFNQPGDFIVHDFSAYEDKGIIQIIESYPYGMIDYCLKYFDDDKLAQIKRLSLYYENEEDFEAAIAQKFANDYSPLVFENQIVVKYKDGSIQWIIDKE